MHSVLYYFTLSIMPDNFTCQERALALNWLNGKVVKIYNINRKTTYLFQKGSFVITINKSSGRNLEKCGFNLQ
jgi:hypothetical protein